MDDSMTGPAGRAPGRSPEEAPGQAPAQAPGEPARASGEEPGRGSGAPGSSAYEPAAPAPLGVERAPTGHSEVDERLARLADADHLPVQGHAEVYEDVHQGLRDALTALDARPGPPGPPAPPTPPVPGAPGARRTG
ncbi:hypothetical protein [Streptomyces sp. NRRL F-5135]|uniref:hypothetical protein n=1 Tax=Streptomyces sp. NRRL F-5135 TaxID=1463858 RepID=UPI00099D13D6|nr:hypothetical protein [Streptomyces sp. NRRL F-5135]